MAIQSFRCAETAVIFQQKRVQRWVNIAASALKKLRILHAAHVLQDLRIPPGDRLGQHSIRINDQWRICFVWTPEGPADVEIVDYH